MNDGVIGKEYSDKEVICRQGERGDFMYVLEAGRVQVVKEVRNGEVVLSELTRGDIFGEMSIFAKEPRSATVRSLGKSRVLTLDKRAFLRRVHEDPSLAFLLLQKLSQRIRSLDEEIARLRPP